MVNYWLWMRGYCLNTTHKSVGSHRLRFMLLRCQRFCNRVYTTTLLRLCFTPCLLRVNYCLSSLFCYLLISAIVKKKLITLLTKGAFDWPYSGLNRNTYNDDNKSLIRGFRSYRGTKSLLNYHVSCSDSLQKWLPKLLKKKNLTAMPLILIPK